MAPNSSTTIFPRSSASEKGSPVLVSRTTSGAGEPIGRYVAKLAKAWRMAVPNFFFIVFTMLILNMSFNIPGGVAGIIASQSHGLSSCSSCVTFPAGLRRFRTTGTSFHWGGFMHTNAVDNYESEPFPGQKSSLGKRAMTSVALSHCSMNQYGTNTEGGQ